MADFEDSYCDWCNKYMGCTTNSRSLVMGYNGLFGMGEIVCSDCLNKEKTRLYLVKHSGRRIYTKEDYFNQYWKGQSKVKVVRTPQDHQVLAQQVSDNEMSDYSE
jgi:hypothetical protein